jgi:hypothetical protein
MNRPLVTTPVTPQTCRLLKQRLAGVTRLFRSPLLT